jgi:tRNA wybutosine-synthesizing protein 2
MKKKPFEMIYQQCASVVPTSFLSFLPKKWEKIGDVLLLKLALELSPYQSDIGKAYAKVLCCKSVLKEKGAIDGFFRTPDVELIWGDPDTVTMHHENGIRFRLDPAKVMFSSGNIDERKRMSTIASKDETVIDLFAGIGYFSIPLAVYSRPCKVIACEINPEAYEFLQQNIVLNDVIEIIRPLLGDNKNTAPRDVADRVIMGYFGFTMSYLPTALSCLKDEGGIIHYHDLFPDDSIKDGARENIVKIVWDMGKTAIVKNVRKVKSFAPGIGHYVFDIGIRP